jgi:hypothetical protein
VKKQGAGGGYGAQFLFWFHDVKFNSRRQTLIWDFCAELYGADGDWYGDGDGYGDGGGLGNGNGFGDGFGDGYGYGDGNGSGEGDGYGEGDDEQFDFVCVRRTK